MNRGIKLAIAALLIAGSASAASTPSFGTRVVECHGEYDYAGLLPPATDQLGLDTKGITLFGTPVKVLLSKYSNEWDQESYAYTLMSRSTIPVLSKKV